MAVETETTDAEQEAELEGRLGDNAPHVGRNYFLGVLAGGFAGASRDFRNPELILVGLVYLLTDSPVLAGVIPVIAKAGILGPQLLIGSLIEHASRRKPYFVLVTVLRGLAMMGLVGATYLLTRTVSALTLGVFYLTYLTLRVITAGGAVVWNDMVGRLIPADRVGGLFGARGVLGGVLGIVGSLLVIQPILNTIEVPMNYLLLAVIGGGLAIIDMSIWCMSREEPGPGASTHNSFGDAIRRGIQWLREDHNYRCYFWARVAFRISYLGLAFFIPYGSERLHYEGGAGGVALLGGIMVAVLKISRVLGGVVWGKVSDRFGSKVGLTGSGLLLTIAPVLALGAARLPEAFSVRLPGLSGAFDLPMAAYLLALACFGSGMRGMGISGKRFLITNAPQERRPSYVAFLNTVTSPLTFLPLAGAYLAKVAGMDALFTLIIAGGLLSLLAALRMRPAEAKTPTAV